MSGANYLKNLRRGELNEIATDTRLPNASSYKTKEDLAPALDEHLKANSTTFASSTNKLIGTYYAKTSSKARSPVKGLPEKLPEVFKTDDEQQPVLLPKQRRRKTTTHAPPDDHSVHVPDRRSSTILQQTQEAVAVSPARVAAAFESQVTTVKEQVSDVFDKLHLAEYTEAFRHFASTPFAIALLAGLYEASSVTRSLVPLKHLHDLEVAYSGTLKLYVPDLFTLLEYTNFWEPTLVWLLTSLLLPLLASYLINIPWKVQATTHSHYNTRRSASSNHHSSSSNSSISGNHGHGPKHDLFVFFITKALLAYLVYAENFQYFGLFTRLSTVIVNDSFYDHYRHVLTTSAVGAALTLYEAVLHK